MSEIERVDIVISGGGPAGLIAAAAFGSAGFSVVCVDPSPPVIDGGSDKADLRTTAFLQPSVGLLEKAGLWPRFARHAAALRVMRIVDAGGETSAARFAADFRSDELSDQPFGWNIPNWRIRAEAVERLSELPSVSFRPGVGTAAIVTREGEVRVTLTDGARLACRLLLAADGRASPVREALGIGVRTFRYGQKALAFSVAHPIPHDNVSTEIHRSGGPFTLVPLPDVGGAPASAVVWMERGEEISRLAALPEAEFNAALDERSGRILGPLTLIGRRSVWPIISQIADRFSAERTALVAEAAHVVPPIGAQGLNMSLADVRCLLDMAAEAPGSLGDRAMLDGYHRRRWPEARARVAGIDLLNRASMEGAALWRDLRGQALRLIHDIAPVRRTLMRAGLGIR